MEPVLPPLAAPRRRWWAPAAWPTGTKLFLILIAALLPLALVALFAAIQSNRIADTETRARLRVAATESARALAIEIIGDMTALRVALDALDSDPADTPSCARVQGVFADQIASGARFVIADRAGHVICGARLPPEAIAAAPPPPGPVAAAILPGRALALTLTAPSRRLTATALISNRALADIARPSGFMPTYVASIVGAGDRLTLQDMPDLGALDRTETIAVPLGIDSLSFEMTVRSAPLTSPLILAMMLPVLMWGAAAGIAWFVVDRMLVQPLQLLRHQVARYQPGEIIDPGDVARAPAQEIRDLGETFSAISRTLLAHEQGLADGLVRQTKLTREVHHRVKNNLQVISSLINLHARGAHSPEAAIAYATIQRRVDALAVVHRNHFAELEETRGVQLRSVIGDLCANIRATAPDGTGLSIMLDLDPYLGNQDVAIAIAFMLTELIELAMMVQADAVVRVSLRPIPDDPARALLRVSSPALIDSDRLGQLLAERYGRVMEGLSRQLRSRLHHEPLSGGYEISVAVTGRD